MLQLPASKPAPQVWVPSDEVVFYKIALPLNRRYAWAKLAPFALEERIIGELDDFHFALGALQKDGQLPVAAVKKESMDAWMALLLEHSLSPEKIWPDVLAVPYEGGGAVLWHEGGRCLLRLDGQTGVAGSLEWLSALMDLRSDSLSKIKVYSDAVDQLPESLRRRAEPLPRPLSACMAEPALPPAAAMNLLQGSYRLSSPLTVWFYPWMKAAAAGLVALSFYLVNTFIQTQTIDDQNIRMRQSMMRFFQNHFPSGDARSMRASVDDLVKRLERGVDAMSASPWLALLRVDRILSQCEACRVEKINLNKEFVSLEISSSAALDSLLSSLEEIENLETEVRSLNDLSEEGETRKRVRFEFKVKKT